MFIFSGVRFICSLTLTLNGPCFAQADNGKMRAANGSYAIKMNIIVILALQEQNFVLNIEIQELRKLVQPDNAVLVVSLSH